jgi:oligoendopeptidase F
MRLFSFRTLSRLILGGLLVPVLLSAVPHAAQAQELKERKDIDPKYKWDLTSIYATDGAWEADVERLEGMIPTLKGFEGKISQSPENLMAFLKATEDAGKIADNAFAYSMMAYDQDTRDQKYTGMKDRIASLGTQMGEATAWSAPELVSIPDATFEKWYKEKPELAMYRQYINDYLRTRAHTLSAPEERILALSGNLAQSPGNASTALRNTDMVFPTIKDDKGNDVQLSEGRVPMLLESTDGRVRRDASMNLLRTYGKFKNTAAALMTGNIQKDMYFARSRNYKSCLEASLDNECIDTTVYLNLLKTVKANLAPLHKYVGLRKAALGLDEIHNYDFAVALIPETRIEVKYEDAVKQIETALSPLGAEYETPMSAGFRDHWVDVYETKGKRSGAYSTSSYTSHPYMLLNYNNTLDDMFTVAHEMGHCMHSYFSHKNQPYVYGDYRYFVAEVASTFNEALLMDNLLKKEKDPAKRLYLINQYIDNVRGTLITQVMFADFELRMHQAAEAGEPLTADKLGEMYLATMKDYYGDTVNIDPEYAYTWIRIPHFYRNFYVYRYATSFCASQALAQKVINKDKGAKEAFIKFLSSGSSKYPLDLLKDAGVDMSKPAPVEATMKKFGQLVDEMEKLLKQTGRIPSPKK